MTTTTTNIADHMDRIYPSMVDESPLDYGEGQMSGHTQGIMEDDGDAADADGRVICIGSYDGGGSVGSPIYAIHPGDEQATTAYLASIADGAETDIDELLDGLRSAGVRVTAMY